jgi:hypothetical protein
MPVEIREIIIRTEISSGSRDRSGIVGQRELERLRQRLINECMQMLSVNTKKAGNKR